jgi:hypothetical protein
MSMSAGLFASVCVAGNAIDPNYALNLTVYHINQLKFTGLTNMNSGDARGDLFFFLRSSSWPV